MAGREHDGAIVAVLFKNRGHEHGRRGRQSRVKNSAVGLLQTLKNGRLNAVGRKT